MDKKITKIIARYVRAQGRADSPDFNPDLRSLLSLEEILLPLTRAQKNLTRAFTLFVNMKAPKITPDGMVGGKGFVMSLGEIKNTINDSIERLSQVIDAVDDEVSNNPVWVALKKQREEEQQQQIEEPPQLEPEESKDEEPHTFEELRGLEQGPAEQPPDFLTQDIERDMQENFEEEMHVRP